MLSPLFVGIVLGLSAGLSPGPLLTLVITQTLTYGIKEGMKVAVAPFATDVPIIVVSLLLLNRVTDFKPLLGVITAAGAIYVFYLAYESVKTKPVLPGTVAVKAQSLQKGTLVNFLNPHPYLFWITVGGPLVLKFNAKGVAGPVLFMAGFYLLLVGSKLGLAFMVGRSRRLLTGRGYGYIMRLLGCALALFAFFLLKDAAAFLGLWPA